MKSSRNACFQSQQSYYWTILILGVLADILQGGVMSGWPSLSQIIKYLGAYSKNCISGPEVCASQEDHFSLDWNAAVLAVNFGPLLMGYFLDRCGPRIMAVIGTTINLLSVLILAHSPIFYLDTFLVATFGLGLGGITFHLSQFHKVDTFPNFRGTISSCFNAGYSVSACIMMLIYAMWWSGGRDVARFRIILYAYAGLLGLVIPLLWWLEPSTALGTRQSRDSDQENRIFEQDTIQQPLIQPLSLPHISAHHCQQQFCQGQNLGGTDKESCQLLEGSCTASSSITSNGESIPLERQSDTFQNQDVVDRDYGTQNRMPLSPRWLWLKHQKFLTQVTSPEAIGLCLYHAMSIIILQFYIGTARLQLEIKGDSTHFYANLSGPVQVLGFVAIPFVGWLLDGVGFGATLLIVLSFGILDSFLQIVPNLQTQIATLIIWSIDRFALNSAFYSVAGSIFGFENFGKLVAVKSIINGSLGFLQYPVLRMVVEQLGGSFLWVQVGQVIIQASLIPFCIKMIKWAKVSTLPPFNVSQEQTQIV